MATNLSSSFPHLEEHNQQQPPKRRGSGRRKTMTKGCDSSTTTRKKPLQRGMGVEKLERLRIQQINPNTNTNNHQNMVISPTPSASNVVTNRVIFPKLDGFVSPNSTTTTHVPGFNVNGNNNMNNLNQGGVVGGGYLGGTGFNYAGFNQRTTTTTTEQISSNPLNVVKCFSDHCNACHKKKKVVVTNGDQNMGSGTTRVIKQEMNMYMQSNNNNVNIIGGTANDFGGSGPFLGFNNVGLDINQNMNIMMMSSGYENQGFGTKLPLVLPSHLGYSAPVPNAKTGVEVVAVHRRKPTGYSEERDHNVLMEYEFFPATLSRNSSRNNLFDDETKKVSSTSSYCYQQGCYGPILDGDYHQSSSSDIDLSLKL